MAKIKKVIYSKPVTCIVWEDGTMTKSRCDEIDTYDELSGFMLCVFKKLMHAKQMRKLFADYVYGDNPKKIKREGASRRFSIGELPALDARYFLIGDDIKNVGVLDDVNINEVLQYLDKYLPEDVDKDVDEEEEEIEGEITIKISADTPINVVDMIEKLFKEYDL